MQIVRDSSYMHKWWAHHPKFQNKHNKSSNEIWIWIDIKSNEFDFFSGNHIYRPLLMRFVLVWQYYKQDNFWCVHCTQHILECNFCFSFKTMWSFFVSVHLFANDWFMCDVQILHFFLVLYENIKNRPCITSQVYFLP